MFPSFRNSCNVILKNLIKFHFEYEININESIDDILKNIYKNLNNMPYLKSFYLKINKIKNYVLFKNFIDKFLYWI